MRRESRMHKIARLLTLAFVLLQSAAIASAQTCEYAGQTFSQGATVCECPNLRVVRNATGGRGEITRRRLACSKGQSWVNTNTLCFIADTWPGDAEDAFKKNHATIVRALRSITLNCKRPSPKRPRSFSARRRRARRWWPSRRFAVGFPISPHSSRR